MTSRIGKLLCNNKDAEQQREEDNAAMMAVAFAQKQQRYRSTTDAIGSEGMEMLEIAEKIRDLAVQLQLQREHNSNVAGEQQQQQLDESLNQSLHHVNKSLEESSKLDESLKKSLMQASSSLKSCKEGGFAAANGKSKTPKAGNLTGKSSLTTQQRQSNHAFTTLKTPRHSNVSSKRRRSVPLTSSWAANTSTEASMRPRSLTSIEASLLALQTTLNQNASKSARAIQASKDNRNEESSLSERSKLMMHHERSRSRPRSTSRSQSTSRSGSRSRPRSSSRTKSSSRPSGISNASNNGSMPGSDERSIEFDNNRADAVDQKNNICVTVGDADIKIGASSMKGFTLKTNSGESSPPMERDRCKGRTSQGIQGKIWNMIRGGQTEISDDAFEPSSPPLSKHFSMVRNYENNKSSTHRVKIIEKKDGCAKASTTSRSLLPARTSSSSSVSNTVPPTRSSKSSMSSEDDILLPRDSPDESEDDILHSRSSKTAASSSIQSRAKSFKNGNSNGAIDGKNKNSTRLSSSSLRQNNNFVNASVAIEACSSNLSNASGFLSPQENRRQVKYWSIKNATEKGVEIILHDNGAQQKTQPVNDTAAHISGLASNSSSASSSMSRYDQKVLRERASMSERLRRHQRSLDEFRHELDASSSFLAATKWKPLHSAPPDVAESSTNERRTRAVLDLLDRKSSSSSASTYRSGSTGTSGSSFGPALPPPTPTPTTAAPKKTRSTSTSRTTRITTISGGSCASDNHHHLGPGAPTNAKLRSMSTGRTTQITTVQGGRTAATESSRQSAPQRAIIRE